MWKKAGQPDRELCKDTVTQWIGEQPSQRHFQVSADARTLAFTHTQTRNLHVLRRGADAFSLGDVAGNEIRFAPYAAEIAVLRNPGYSSSRVIERVDLRRFERKIGGEVHAPQWIEYCRDGLVVLHSNVSGSSRILSLLSWQGEMRTIAETSAWTVRFTCGKASNRIVYFDGMNVFSVDSEGSEPKKWMSEPGKVRNAEMSPDGQKLLFATDDALYWAEGEGERRVLAEGEKVHSLWFSRDGREFAFASNKRAVWQKEGETRELPAEENAPVEALRFCPASPGLLVSRGQEVILWNPEANQQDVLVHLEAPLRVIGADLFYGGIVVWAAEPWEFYGPRFKGNPFD